ncbi:hypothetical protein KVH02_11685 [Streptomyces olivaceus]|uniref:Integrase n=1 Tax=Streptomyces olivaceus TaxID=47716 RepID=A0ABS7W0H1_STROV|nr:hypothetical protein [Streptomyces olivaceus]MBZ6088982.1 hypothetical protein [Streptomyces olivaceus]MBZ6095644.1 hypothetical protein [Streptomyces olivaceus]MBZ6119913.1 hypothetical protein [Streptomyces olivaceus]MBZ6151464.1 hypothetical protein [Streptomyces olivaceus]MBZ6298414.1 hypothetical protein [Streptomyces olivaceus]
MVADPDSSLDFEDLYYDVRRKIGKGTAASLPRGTFSRILRHLGLDISHHKVIGLAYGPKGRPNHGRKAPKGMYS